MKHILISDKLSQAGIDALKQHSNISFDIETGLSPEQLQKMIGKYDGLIVRSSTQVDQTLIKKASQLKVIGRAGTGVDNIDITAATHHGIVVMNTPAANTITTAEHSMAMLMSLARNIPQAYHSMKQGKWDRHSFLGCELYNKTLGIVGLGHIGQALAKRVKNLGMRVIAYDPFVSEAIAEECRAEICELEALVAQADFITVHTPLNDRTRHLIDQSMFDRMQPHARILNCARGGIIDEAALLNALQTKQIAGAALDVYEEEPLPADHPFLSLDNIICTPHLGASTSEAQHAVAVAIAEQVSDYLLNDNIRYAVNTPAFSAEQMQRLGPYLNLAERMGRFQGQQSHCAIQAIELSYYGEVSEESTAAISAAYLKGLLSCMLDVTINAVNAQVLVKERGIQLKESRIADSPDFTSMIQARLTSKQGSTQLSGTLFGHQHPRLVELDGFMLEAYPQGEILLTRHDDKPGVLGKIGNVLGQHQVNISRMQLGTQQDAEQAMALFNLDSTISDKALNDLQALDDIVSVQCIHLED